VSLLGARAERPFERVYTVMDYYDVPRSGFAEFRGVPHAYRAIWSVDLDDWDSERRYHLSPIPAETLALALEDWEIWQRWLAAYHQGQTTGASHPSLEVDRPRHVVLAPLIQQALDFDPTSAIIAVGEFRTSASFAARTGSGGVWEVRWTVAP
jgi:hypothetical protein